MSLDKIAALRESLKSDEERRRKAKELLELRRKSVLSCKSEALTRLDDLTSTTPGKSVAPPPVHRSEGSVESSPPAPVVAPRPMAMDRSTAAPMPVVTIMRSLNSSLASSADDVPLKVWSSGSAPSQLAKELGPDRRTVAVLNVSTDSSPVSEWIPDVALATNSKPSPERTIPARREAAVHANPSTRCVETQTTFVRSAMLSPCPSVSPDDEGRRQQGPNTVVSHRIDHVSVMNRLASLEQARGQHGTSSSSTGGNYALRFAVHTEPSPQAMDAMTAANRRIAAYMRDRHGTPLIPPPHPTSDKEQHPQLSPRGFGDYSGSGRCTPTPLEDARARTALLAIAKEKSLYHDRVAQQREELFRHRDERLKRFGEMRSPAPTASTVSRQTPTAAYRASSSRRSQSGGGRSTSEVSDKLNRNGNNTKRNDNNVRVATIDLAPLLLRTSGHTNRPTAPLNTEKRERSRSASLPSRQPEGHGFHDKENISTTRRQSGDRESISTNHHPHQQNDGKKKLKGKIFLD